MNGILRFKKRLKKFIRGHQADKIEFKHIHQSIQSWIGHVSHANTWRLRELVFGDFVLQKREGGLIELLVRRLVEQW